MSMCVCACWCTCNSQLNFVHSWHDCTETAAGRHTAVAETVTGRKLGRAPQSMLTAIAISAATAFGVVYR